MPISRSSTIRNKSRSPAPPPLTPNPSVPKVFLPPSHYAAPTIPGGGFNSRSPVIRMGNNNNAVGREESEFKRSRSRQSEAKRKDGRIGDEVPMPIAIGSSDSDSFHTVDNGPTTFAMAQSIPRSGFPDLEAQLLPSLRDTIDRMTGASSRIPQQLQFKTSDPSKRVGKNQPTHQHSTDSRVYPLQITKLQHPIEYRSEELNASHIYSDQVTSPIANPVSRLKAPAKSTLKSSLKSPTATLTPTIKSPMPSITSVTSPSTTGSSLRTMKSLLTRKCSGTLKSPFKPSSEGIRLDRKDTSVTPTPIPSSFESTPGNFRVEADREHQTGLSNKKSFHSNIPRPYTSKYHQDHPIETHNIEDSDLDRRYDNELRDRRKLTVANAEVPISISSESDAESRKRFDLTNAIKNSRNLKFREQDRGPIGLGFSVRKNHLENQDLVQPQPRYRQEARSRSPDNNLRAPSQQEKSLRFSLPASESAGSSYSDDFNDHQCPDSYRRHSSPDSVCTDFKRKSGQFHSEGVQSAVSPDSRHRRPSRTSPKPSRRKSSPNCQIYDASTDEETESEREGYAFRRKRSQERHQSPSYSRPPLHGTYSEEQERLDESDGFVPIVPPKHRFSSTAQHHEASSPRAPEAYSPTLRELIKRRHSSSKPFAGNTQSAAHNPHPGTPRQRNGEFGMAGSSSSPAPHRASPRRDINHYYPQEHTTEGKERSLRRTAASVIADDYRAAAARERMAFGIPPSESDELMNAQDQDQDDDDQRLSSVDSKMSSLNASLWQEDSEDMSDGAVSIFRSLRYSKKGRDSNELELQYDRTPRLSVVSPTLSGSSTGNNEHPPNRPNEPQDPTNAAATASAPKTREGVIQEIFETEEELIRHFHICMNMFILPLRVHNSRSWISGVPPDIARLLDWFDDIVNLHEQIYDCLCAARDTMSPATDRVSESLRCFVLKVEVYQPYLVRLADVSEEIARLVEDTTDEFGQFISLQQQSPDCLGWSFESLLMLPVKRLAAYQDLFARLLDLTPKTHQDYLSTFSLSRSTDMVIKIMTEVKIREDEYSLLKRFSSRIQGLPPSNGLATRERRLLYSGSLSMVLSGLSETSSKESWDPGHQLQASESKRADRSSRLLDAISISSAVYGRSEMDSEKSASSFDSSTGNGPVATSTPVKSSWFSRLPLRKRARPKSPLSLPVVSEPSLPSRDVSERPPVSYLKTAPVHAFVFSDLVLLAQPSPTQQSDSTSRWTLSSTLGVFRPLSIARVQDRKQEGTVLSLEALVLNGDDFSDNIDFRAVSFVTIDLLLPRSDLSRPCSSNPDSDDIIIDETFEPWILAFRQCAKTTLRKLTFLGLGAPHDPFYGSDKTLDTLLAVSSLVSSGLPIPRSPSGHFPEQFKETGEELSGDEREERGWWSLRYQQVFREFQRQDSLLSDDEDVV